MLRNAAPKPQQRSSMGWHATNMQQIVIPCGGTRYRRSGAAGKPDKNKIGGRLRPHPAPAASQSASSACCSRTYLVSVILGHTSTIARTVTVPIFAAASLSDNSCSHTSHTETASVQQSTHNIPHDVNLKREMWARSTCLVNRCSSAQREH